MAAIAGISWTFGQPEKLIYASDYKGQTCGMPATTDAQIEQGADSVWCGTSPGTGLRQDCGKYATFPKLGEEVQDALMSGMGPQDLMSLQFYTVCVSACPTFNSWVCSYEMREFFDEKYGDARDDDLETLPAAAIVALDKCQGEKNKAGGAFGSYGLSEPCKTYLTAGCWKATITETDMFFRCLPLPENNQTCTDSPYLASQGVAGPSRFRRTPDCNESAALHGYGLDSSPSLRVLQNFDRPAVLLAGEQPGEDHLRFGVLRAVPRPAAARGRHADDPGVRRVQLGAGHGRVERDRPEQQPNFRRHGRVRGDRAAAHGRREKDVPVKILQSTFVD